MEARQQGSVRYHGGLDQVVETIQDDVFLKTETRYTEMVQQMRLSAVGLPCSGNIKRRRPKWERIEIECSRALNECEHPDAIHVQLRTSQLENW